MAWVAPGAVSVGPAGTAPLVAHHSCAVISMSAIAWTTASVAVSPSGMAGWSGCGSS